MAGYNTLATSKRQMATIGAKIFTRRGQPSDSTQAKARSVLVTLMAPSFMMILMNTMIGVALPAIRAGFGIDVDLVAWVVTIYTLPYVIFMPLYGRLGDGLGRRRFLVAGMVIFILGTAVDVLAPSLPWLMLGRTIQGLGAAGFVPLAMAIISEMFPSNERGKALGTWNSAGPMTALVGPLLGGLLVDSIGWRTIFVPVTFVGLMALLIVAKKVPRVQGNANSDFLRTFDWAGAGLLGTSVVALLFFVSSEKITGVHSFQDWRMLALTALFFTLFLMWERKQTNPFVNPNLFSHKAFSLASAGASTRMFVMSSISFLLPLYLVDVQHLNAFQTGLVFTLHAGALLVTMRMGGQVADRWGSRRPVVGGMTVQMGIMLYLALLPGTIDLVWVIAGLLVHGLGAGLAVAAFHRAALKQVPSTEMGVAAGLYSMTRFAGTVLGTAVVGTLLQQGLNRGLSPVQAYHLVFAVVAVVALAGVLLGTQLNEQDNA